MSRSGQTFLFFIKSPNLENLVKFTLRILTDEQLPKQSIFNQKIFKCRELIFTESDIVATPDQYSENQIIAVLPKNRFCAPEFKQKLDKMGLKLLRVDDVSPSVLQECLQYTAISKLAPQWNIVQRLMVQGRDFLTTSAPLKAVHFELVVNNSEIILCVKPTCVKMPHFKTENYINLSEPQKTHFCIDEKCHVLPSFKVGKAISMSKDMWTTSSSLKSYPDLKKYWKNMYGYRLPDISEQNVWYVNVAFNMRWTPLMYPSFCIRPYGMTEVPRVDPQPTLQAFLADFCRKVGSICNEKCKILDLRASFPLLKTYPAADVIENATPKVGATYTMAPTNPYRSAVPSSEGSDKININGQAPTSKLQFPKRSVNDSAQNGSKDLLSKTSTQLCVQLQNYKSSPKSSVIHAEETYQQSFVSSTPTKKNGQFDLCVDANLNDNLYFKKFGSTDLSFLSANFKDLQMQTRESDALTKNATSISTDVPRFAPKFLPRQKNIRTMPEMFPKVKASVKRKHGSNDDSESSSGSSATTFPKPPTSLNSFIRNVKESKTCSRGTVQKPKAPKNFGDDTFSVPSRKRKKNNCSVVGGKTTKKAA